jgi:hypothetical protein
MNSRLALSMVAALIGLHTGSAAADQWGCEVLLCLSNPAGPTAVAECKPPIHRLWRHLAHGHAFPTCDMARGSNGASYARQGFSYYDPCPAGTRALASGEQAARVGAVRTVGARSLYSASGAIYSGIGTGDGYFPNERTGGLPPKVCVGNKLGATTVNYDARSSYQVTLYDRIVTLAPQRSPRIIDVYINDAFYKRVRW